MRNLLITFALMLGFAVTAHAQTYNVDFINDNPNGADSTAGERGVTDGTILEFDGIYIQFSATSTTGEGYAYFDAGNAGLGVCTTVTGLSQCDPSSDDNLTSGETLIMSVFSDAGGQSPIDVRLGDMVFRDAGHNIVDAYSVLFGIDGGGMVSTSMAGFGWSDPGHTFAFGYDGTQYYISGMTILSGVPEPATWLMMIIGFGIVSATARRSRRPNSIAHTC